MPNFCTTRAYKIAAALGRFGTLDIMDRQVEHEHKKQENEAPVHKEEQEHDKHDRESQTKFSGHGAPPAIAEAMKSDPTASERAFGDSEFHEYVKTVGVAAEQLHSPLDWVTSSGDKMHAEAGDWKITGADGSTWSVKPDIFAKTYTETAPGHYIKSAPTNARVLTKQTTIKTLEGTGSGNAGDYLVRGPNGEEYIVPKAKFESMYKRKDAGSSPRKGH